ncbi:methyl-accepting chemotaxis protein [Pseudomonas capeferrum]|nr:methyl-accepting chemotaxis protein [Pseudomonas capeferrum]
MAGEVRTLARRTQHSTTEIERMIDSLRNRVGATVKTMGDSHQMAGATASQADHAETALDNILTAIGLIVEQSQQIAAAAEQQTAVSQGIGRSARSATAPPKGQRVPSKPANSCSAKWGTCNRP